MHDEVISCQANSALLWLLIIKNQLACVSLWMFFLFFAKRCGTITYTYTNSGDVMQCFDCAVAVSH